MAYCVSRLSLGHDALLCGAQFGPLHKIPVRHRRDTGEQRQTARRGIALCGALAGGWLRALTLTLTLPLNPNPTPHPNWMGGWLRADPKRALGLQLDHVPPLRACGVESDLDRHIHLDPRLSLWRSRAPDGAPLVALLRTCRGLWGLLAIRDSWGCRGAACGVVDGRRGRRGAGGRADPKCGEHDGIQLRGISFLVHVCLLSSTVKMANPPN